MTNKHLNRTFLLRFNRHIINQNYFKTRYSNKDLTNRYGTNFYFKICTKLFNRYWNKFCHVFDKKPLKKDLTNKYWTKILPFFTTGSFNNIFKPSQIETILPFFLLQNLLTLFWLKQFCHFYHRIFKLSFKHQKLNLNFAIFLPKDLLIITNWNNFAIFFTTGWRCITLPTLFVIRRRADWLASLFSVTW